MIFNEIISASPSLWDTFWDIFGEGIFWTCVIIFLIGTIYRFVIHPEDLSDGSDDWFGGSID